MKLTLCFLFLLTTVSALTDEEGQAKLEKLQGSMYGKTILDTIALQLEAEDSADDLVLMLRGTEDRKFQEQRKDDESQMELQNQCYDDLGRLADEIKTAEKRVHEVSEELEEKVPIRDNKVNERADLQEFKTLLEDRLRQMEANKEVRKEQWSKTKEEHDHAA